MEVLLWQKKKRKVQAAPSTYKRSRDSINLGQGETKPGAFAQNNKKGDSNGHIREIWKIADTKHRRR